MIEPRDTLLDLFDEYAAAYVAGRRPDVLAYLERAGDEADAFERLVDAFLQAAPPRGADPVEVALIDARVAGEPPLLSLRKRLVLRVDEVAGGLAERLGLGAGALGSLGRRYQELEGGVLEPAGVAPEVWAALRALFGVDVRGLAAAVVAPPEAPGAFARVASNADWGVDADVAAAPVPSARVDPVEAEVDRLFGVGG